MVDGPVLVVTVGEPVDPVFDVVVETKAVVVGAEVVVVGSAVVEDPSSFN